MDPYVEKVLGRRNWTWKAGTPTAAAPASPPLTGENLVILRHMEPLLGFVLGCQGKCLWRALHPAVPVDYVAEWQPPREGHIASCMSSENRQFPKRTKGAEQPGYIGVRPKSSLTSRSLGSANPWFLCWDPFPTHNNLCATSLYLGNFEKYPCQDRPQTLKNRASGSLYLIICIHIYVYISYNT